MKEETSNVILTGALIGIGVVGIGLLAYDIMEKRVDKLENTLNAIQNSVKSISGDVDLTVPDDVVRLAVTQAAEKASNRAVDSAIKSIQASVEKTMDGRVTSTINSIYSNIENDLKNTLLEKVNTASIERIENSVSDKVSKQVLKNFIVKNVSTPTYVSTGNGKAEAIKALAENGFDDWEIRRVLEKM